MQLGFCQLLWLKRKYCVNIIVDQEMKVWCLVEDVQYIVGTHVPLAGSFVYLRIK